MYAKHLLRYTTQLLVHLASAQLTMVVAAPGKHFMSTCESHAVTTAPTYFVHQLCLESINTL